MGLFEAQLFHPLITSHHHAAEDPFGALKDDFPQRGVQVPIPDAAWVAPPWPGALVARRNARLRGMSCGDFEP